MTVTVGPGAKSISQFLPLARLSADEADRHYLAVHSRFARTLLRSMPHVVSYHTNRAEAEFDLNGRWRQRPRAFRFVVLRFRPGRSLEFPDDVRELIVQDHRQFLRELRGFRVIEDVVLDRLSGQTALQKYLFEFEQPDEDPPELAAAHLDELVDVLLAQAPDAFGLRQILVNRVTSEGAVEAVDEPGQRPVDQTLASTTKSAFVEFYFDHSEWAEHWFARTAVRRALRSDYWALSRGYWVTEECGLDRR